jgi:opacity protein-like surface antigen
MPPSPKGKGFTVAPTLTSQSRPRMKLSCACVLLVAVSALATSAAQAVDIDYTVTGLTTWNGRYGEGISPGFDPTPDHPFQLTYNLNDAIPGASLVVTSDMVYLTGVSLTTPTPPVVLSIAGAPSIEISGPAPFTLLNPATFDGGLDLEVFGGALQTQQTALSFSGPALFHYANGQATFETGTFNLAGGFVTFGGGGSPYGAPLVDVVLTAQPVPEGPSWLLVASCAAGVGGAYSVRRRRLRPAPSPPE